MRAWNSEGKAKKSSFHFFWTKKGFFYVCIFEEDSGKKYSVKQKEKNRESRRGERRKEGRKERTTVLGKRDGMRKRNLKTDS